MGFLDKAKEQANQLATKAQQGLQQGQAKIDDVQSGRQADALLRGLGAWQWAAEHGRDDGQAAQEMERIRADLAAHEVAHGPLPAPAVFAPPDAGPAPAGEAPPPPPGQQPTFPPPSFPPPTQPPGPMHPGP